MPKVERDREPYSPSQHTEVDKALKGLYKMEQTLMFEGLTTEANSVRASYESLKSRMLLYYQT